MLVKHVWAIFDFSVQGHFDGIQCTCLKMTHNLKKSGSAMKYKFETDVTVRTLRLLMNVYIVIM